MVKRFLLCISLLGAMILQAAVYTPSTVPDPKKQGQDYYVSDPDSIIGDKYVTNINMVANILNDSTDVELATVVLGSIGEMDAFDFAYELFQRWGIGGKGRNTGVLMLFVLDSHDIRIMTGTGIEGVLTDAKCSKIIHEDMIPIFKMGYYGEGLFRGALRILEICTKGEIPEELQNMVSVTNRGKYADDDDGLSTDTKIEIFGWCFFGGIIALIFIAAFFGSVKKCPKCLKRKAKRTRSETLVAATYSHGGEEKNTYTCKACGYSFTVVEKTPRLRDTSDSDSGGSYSSGGGGGGSWGGGSTSGGGAGGKW